MRGALRTSRTRGGMRWTEVAPETHAPDAYGEVAWFGRRGAGAKLAIRSASDGGKKAVLREEREVSRKAIAQGRPGCSRRTCMLVCAFAMCIGTRDRGCGVHPVFPAPSFQVEGNETLKPRVKHAARSRKHAHVIASAATQSMPPFHVSLCGPDGLLRLRLIVHLVIFSSWLPPSKHFRCLGTLPSRRAVWQPAHTLGLTASRSQKSRTVHRLAANACGTFIGDNQSINPCVYQ